MKRRLVLALAILALAASGLALVGYLAWPAVPDPPAPDLAGIDPAIRSAVEQAQAEVRQSPRSADAWGKLGMVFTSHIFGDEAMACFAQAEQLDPDDPRWPYHQALIHLAYDPPAALPKLERAVDLCGAKTDGPRVRLAELQLSLGEWDAAREHFEILLQADARHPRALLGLARIDFQAGRLDASRGNLQTALSDARTRKAALILSAEIRQRMGDASGARQERATTLGLRDDPAWPDPYTAELAKLSVGESARLKVAAKLLDLNQHTEAIGLMQKIAQDYPRSANAWTQLGWAQLGRGQIAAAEQSLDTALALQPENARANRFKGICRQEQKDRPQAIVCFKKAIAAKPSYLEAHINLGLCLKEEGDPGAAIAAFQDALRCQPLSALSHAELGTLLLQQGRGDEAIFHLEQAVELRPDDTASRKLLEGAKK